MVSLAVIAGTGNNFFCVICFIDWCVRVCVKVFPGVTEEFVWSLEEIVSA